MPDFNVEMKLLAADIRELMSVTSTIGWDRPTDAVVANPQDLGAKPVPYSDWHFALKCALKLGVANPWIKRPTPGADPEGFVWLTWNKDEPRQFELAIKEDRFIFIMKDDMGKRTVERRFERKLVPSVDAAIRDVSEALRTVMPRPVN